MVRVGIVGAGFGRSVHLPTFRSLDGVEVLAIADSGLGRRMSDLPADVGYCKGWEQLLAMPELDAVSIATPPKFHRDIACAALQRGLHVWCEKPFGMSQAEAREMKHRADASGAILGVNFQFRYEPGIQTLAKAIHEGMIGNLRRLDFTWLTAGRADKNLSWSWQNDAALGGGVIGGFFSHVADLAVWISRRKVVSICGHASTWIDTRRDITGQPLPATAEDSVDAFMAMEDQVACTVRISNVQPAGQGMVVEAAGDDGRLVYTHRPPYLREDTSVMLYTPDGASRLALSFPEVATPGQDTRFCSTRCSAQDFVRVIQGETVVQRATADDAVMAHAAMGALRRALVSGRAEYVGAEASAA